MNLDPCWQASRVATGQREKGIIGPAQRKILLEQTLRTAILRAAIRGHGRLPALGGGLSLDRSGPSRSAWTPYADTAHLPAHVQCAHMYNHWHQEQRCTDRHGSSPEQDTPRCSPWLQPLRCWSATTSSKSEVLAHQSPRPPSAELGCSALFSKGFPDRYTCRGVDWLLFRLPKKNAIEVLAGVPFRIRPCKAAHKQVT